MAKLETGKDRGGLRTNGYDSLVGQFSLFLTCHQTSVTFDTNSCADWANISTCAFLVGPASSISHCCYITYEFPSVMPPTTSIPTVMPPCKNCILFFHWPSQLWITPQLDHAPPSSATPEWLYQMFGVSLYKTQYRASPPEITRPPAHTQRLSNTPQ